MDFFALIEKRRSIRKYKNQPLEAEKVAKIIEAALRAPSSRNLQPWEFIVVTDEKMISALSRAKQHGSSFLLGAPLAMVVCADPEKCDVWVEDAAIASTFISLAAEALGLGNCWIQIRERKHSAEKTAEEFIREILHIPSHLKVESLIAIGYPEEHKTGHQKEELQFGKVFTNIHGERS
ncbi:MAG TPA: NAD(P)H-dependent dehydrogenase/reductase [Firmicutes bacterium]|jgi:nitroreductase|nr:NAD(P)H-dependent dehydrogenase/reductase [Bacillota bacterium]HBK67786.1 NAD(P)H-dependent dehydrogenase/reductase [Bacillota bacterium]